MPNNVSFGVQAKGVKQASSEIDQLKDKFTKLQAQGAKGIGIGIAAGATTFALGELQQALGGAVGFAEDAIKAFNEEQVSIQNLGSSLKANIPGWDGNTAAIEKTIHAQEALGFTDDEQRTSLAKLVAATHDVTKAEEIQSVAMDLARFKHISLADATDALTKVEAGSYRILKSLGIELKNGATQTEALAAVEGIAAGQAKDFAATNEGKVLASQVRVNDAMEKFGAVMAGPVADATVALTGDIEGLASVVEVLNGGFSKDTATASDQAKSILDLVGAFGFLLPGMSALADASKGAITDQQKLTDAYDANAAAVHDMHAQDQADFDAEARAAEHFQRSVVGAFGKVTYASSKWQENYHIDSGKIIRDQKKVADAFIADTQAIIDGYFNPIETRSQLFDTRLQIAADEESKRKAKTKQDSRQAADAIIQDLDDEASALQTLAGQQKLTKKDVDTFAADAKKAYGKIPPALQAIIDHWRTFLKLPNIAKSITITAENKGNFNPTVLTKAENALGFFGNQDLYKHRASGGPVSAGQAYTVGENGPETLVMGGQSGTVLPNGGGGGIHITVNAGIGTSFTAAEGRRLADAILPPLLAGMQRKGVLPRGATGLTG